MKLFNALILSVGTLALTAATSSAQAPMPVAGQTMYRAGEPAAVVIISGDTTAPATTVSHPHGTTAAVVETPCATCGTGATCKACTKDYAAKTKNGYEVQCKEYCVPHVRLFGILSSSCEEPIVKTRKVLIIKQVPDGTRPVYTLNGGASTGGPVQFRTPSGSAETSQPGAMTAPSTPGFQAMPGGRTPSGSAETTQPK